MTPRDVDPAACHATALRLLAGRELSEQQLRQRLHRRGFPDDAIADAVGRLKDTGALDDRRVAFAAARTQLTLRRRGRARTQRELEAIGISRELAREAVSATFEDADEDARIASAIARRRKSGAPIEPAEFRRLYAYLVRQGFPTDAVIRALRRLGRDASDD